MTELISLIHSGDKGRWVWPHWYRHYSKWWTGWEKIDTVLLTEKRDAHFDRVINVKSGRGRWGKELIRALNTMECVYVLYQHEDYFLTGEADIDFLLATAKLMKSENMQLMKCCGPAAGIWRGKEEPWRVDVLQKTDLKVEGVEVLEYPHHVDYLLSHKTSIWNKDFLLSTVKPKYSPWDHEIKGTMEMRNRKEKIYAIIGKTPMPFEATVRRGKIKRDCTRFFKEPNA
jgi:hypothetical protein